MLDINDEKLKKGYIKLYRSLINWGWFTDINTCHLFIYCLLRANHKDGVWRGLNIQRGSFITSLGNLATETGLTIRQVRTALKKLNATNELTSKGNNRNTVIVVNNYEQFQVIDTQDDKQTTSERQTNDKQTTTNNNVNNVNNINIYGAEKNKKFDPYFNNPVIDKFKSEYNKIYKSKCYLDNYKINKLLEISSENPNFTEKLPEILNKFSKLKFFKGEKATKPTLKWLILEGGWAGILNGEYDQFIDKPAPELKKDWTTNELLTCDTSIYDDKEVDGWSL